MNSNENLIDKIKLIKSSRLSENQRYLLDIVNDLEEIYSDHYLGIYNYYYNNKLVFKKYTKKKLFEIYIYKLYDIDDSGIKNWCEKDIINIFTKYLKLDGYLLSYNLKND